MSKKRKRHRQKRQGHYCWCCDCYRPNEKFSGKGHGRHLCRDCRQLGPEELAYRQAVRDIEQCVLDNGRIRPKRRKTFEQFLHHEDSRVRALAESILEEDRLRRMDWQEMGQLEEERLASLLSREEDWSGEPIDMDDSTQDVSPANQYGHDDEVWTWYENELPF